MRFVTSKIGSLMVAAALVPAAVIAQTGQSHPRVDGVWKMDTTKFEKHDRALAGLVLRVSHLGDTLLVITDVQDTGRPAVQMKARYIPVGLVGRDAASDTARHINLASWEGDTLVLRSVDQRPDRTLQIEERWMFDANGTTLSRLQHVLDEKLERVSQQTLVFTRQ